MATAGAGLLVVVAVMVFLSLSLLLPPVAKELGVGMGAVMVFVTINFSMGAASMAFLAPILSRVLGIRGFILTGGIVTAAALAAVPYVSSLAMLYLLAAASGVLFLGSTQMAATLVIDNWYVAKRGLALGIMQAIGGVGGIVAGSVLPAVIEGGGWRLGFWVSAAIVAGVAAVCSLVLIRSRPADVGLRPYGDAHTAADPVTAALEAEADAVEAVASGEWAHDEPSAAEARRSPRFIALVAAIVLFNIVNAVSPNLAPLMQGNGLTLTEAGSLISVLSIGTIVTTLALGAVLDKWGALAGTLLALAAFAAALLVFLTTRGYTGQLVAILLFAVASVLAPIAAPVIVRQLFGGRAFASLVGIALAGMPLGVAVGSPLWGIAYDVAGNYRPALIGGLVLLGVVAGLFTYALLGNRSRASH